MKLTKVGAISEIVLPDSWHETTESVALGTGFRWLRTFSPDSNSTVQLAFFYRGMPVDELSRSYLSYLLKTRVDPLSNDDIASLHAVLGVSTAGNNQFTNNATPGTKEGPVFHLDEAKIANVDEKCVLRVSGSFSSGRCYSGIFFTVDDSSPLVEEFFIQADDKEGLHEYLMEFDRALASIKWD